MSRLLDDLSPELKPLACELIARCAEQGIPVIIVFTGRTPAEQAAIYAQGRTAPGRVVTWTLDSKHVMKPPLNKSDAIDLAPWEEFRMHGPDKIAWDADSPVWDTIGAIGQSLGLKWGVISKGARIDLGHFEYVRPKPGTLVA